MSMNRNYGKDGEFGIQYREERSERIQIKGTSNERETEEQRKRKNMRKRGKNAI